MIPSFSVAYSKILAGPKAGRSSAVDFSALKTFVNWDYSDAQRGLSVTLTRSMQGELEALNGHFEACFGGYPKAKELCLKTLTYAMDLWNSFVPMLTAFHQKHIFPRYAEVEGAPRPCSKLRGR